MERDDHTCRKMFLVILVIQPVGDDLRRRPEKDMEQSAIFAKVGAKFFGNGEYNMTMFAIDKLACDRIGSVCLIGSTAGIAKPRVTAKRYKLVCTTIGTHIKGTAIIRIATTYDFANFRINDGTDIGCFK